MVHDPINDGTTLDGASPAEPPRPRGRALLVCFTLAGIAGCAVLGLLLYQGHEREMALRVALSTSESERAETQTSLDRTRAALQIVTTEREDVRSTLKRVEAERDGVLSKLEATTAALRSVTDERDQVASALRQAEAERASAESSLDSTRGNLRSVIAERDGLRSTLRQTELARDNATRSLSAARDEVSECNEALEQAVSIARSHRDRLDEIASAIRIGMIGVTDIPSEGFVFSGGYDLESEYRKVVKKYNDLVDRFNAAVERSNDLGEIVNRVVNILRS